MKTGTAMLLGGALGVAAGLLVPKAMDFEKNPEDLLDDFEDEGLEEDLEPDKIEPQDLDEKGEKDD